MLAETQLHERLERLKQLGYRDDSPEVSALFQLLQDCKNDSTNNGLSTYQQQQLVTCFRCGVVCELNESKLCQNCFNVINNDITSIPDKLTIHNCRTCNRYEYNNKFIVCEWESKELLALCLKKIPFGKDCKLVGGSFIWTEPHSRRIRVKIGVEKLVSNMAIRQFKQIEYIIANKQCRECAKSVTSHLWVHQIQIRQRIKGARGNTSKKQQCQGTRRNVLYFEQLVLKEGLHTMCSDVKPVNEGIDFNFVKTQNAQQMIAFAKRVIACKVSNRATQLISHNCKNNTYSNKFVTLIELPNVAKDDLVIIPEKTCSLYGGVSQIALCGRITNNLHFVDPFTGRKILIHNDAYWREPFCSLLTRRNMTSFYVIDVDIIDIQAGLAHLTLAKLSRMNSPDQQMYSTVSHIGAKLHPGNIVAGYELRNAVLEDETANKQLDNVDVIVVKLEVTKKVRNWRLKTLQNSTVNYDELAENLEDDPEMRQNINVIMNDTNTEVSLEQLISELSLND